MSAEINIKIKLKNGKKVELTGEEAKQVFQDLKEIYGDKNTYIPYYPWTWHNNPKYTGSPWTTITCGTSSITLSSNNISYMSNL
ncbi:MAG: hypothetical protein ABSG25_07295 [Bryobacteraceae bacterium]